MIHLLSCSRRRRDSSKVGYETRHRGCDNCTIIFIILDVLVGNLSFDFSPMPSSIDAAAKFLQPARSCV